MSNSYLLHLRNSTKLDEVVKYKWNSFRPYVTKFTNTDEYFVKLGEGCLVFLSVHGILPKNLSLSFGYLFSNRE